MWLLPWVHRLSRVASGVYYRLAVAGPSIPRHGPVLLVSNHPNALVDPVLVAAAAGRPVRFLAKAPLFRHPGLGWLVRAAGCIPVYRQQDDPSEMSRNTDSLRAAQEALAAGSAIALFPEGISHDQPALSPLKTGAARIALGAAGLAGRPLPIIPMGIVLREKDRFRSEALVAIGDPVHWEDLSARSVEDSDAVRQLTARIDDGLRAVTVNLEHWEDAPLVECAEAVWATRHGAARDGAERVARLRVATDLLYRFRHDPAARHPGLVAAVTRHSRTLQRFGLGPADLEANLRNETALWWSLRRIPLVLLPAVAVAAAGALLWWVPWRVTGLVAEQVKGDRDQRASYKLFGGILIYFLWLVALGILAAPAGAGTVIAVILGAPLLGFAGLRIRERWRESWNDARRFFLLRQRYHLLRDLRRRQRDLAEQLDALFGSAP